LEVHEWGTFTVLQDEAGREVPGINIDDEPVPPFVHRIGPLVRTDALVDPRGKAILPACHPDVRMRMETPVLYFYPPAGERLSVDVSVEFRGGWISEFYPRGDVVAPGWEEFRLPASAVGTASWRGLQVGVPAGGPQTDLPVWLAPREVDAAYVETPDGERERYVFYRGVANLAAPVRLRREGGVLRVDGVVPQGWLADFRPDGQVAFVRAATEMPAAPAPHAAGNLAALRAEMREALIARGLFVKEAEAMLATWEESYFRRPGLRFFFLVAPDWVEAHLPLRLSREAKVVRAFIGRIELVTPAQRRTLAELLRTAPTTVADVPAEYHQLGRFAPARIAAAHRADPTDASAQWLRVLGAGSAESNESARK
jgi:hypothetical protein